MAYLRVNALLYLWICSADIHSFGWNLCGGKCATVSFPARYFPIVCSQWRKNFAFFLVINLFFLWDMSDGFCSLCVYITTFHVIVCLDTFELSFSTVFIHSFVTDGWESGRRGKWVWSVKSLIFKQLPATERTNNENHWTVGISMSFTIHMSHVNVKPNPHHQSNDTVSCQIPHRVPGCTNTQRCYEQLSSCY